MTTATLPLKQNKSRYSTSATLSRFHTQETKKIQYLYSRVIRTHNSPGKGQKPNKQSVHEKQNKTSKNTGIRSGVTNNKDSVTNTKQAGYLHTEHDIRDGEREQLNAMNSDERKKGLWGMQFQE